MLSGINYFGLKSGLLVQNALSFCGWPALASWSSLAARRPEGRDGQLEPFFQSSEGFEIGSFGLALLAVLWTYDGWYAVNCTRGSQEAREDHTSQLAPGTVIVVVVYLLMNSIYLAALPLEK